MGLDSDHALVIGGASVPALVLWRSSSSVTGLPFTANIT
jgi:hypothetical protein